MSLSFLLFSLFVFAESPISSISFFRNASGFQGSLAESEDSSPNRNFAFFSLERR